MDFLSNLLKKHPLKIILLGLAYVLSPVDFVPDIFLPFGLIDDATILGIMMGAVRELVAKKQAQASSDKQKKNDPDVIDIESEKVD